MKKFLRFIIFIIPAVILFFGVFGLAGISQAATYYVSTTGLDSNPGTSANPWKTFTYALSTMAGGDTLIVKNGTYKLSSGGYGQIKNVKSGTPSQYTVIQAETDGGVIIDGEYAYYYDWPVVLSGNYIRFEGFKVQNGNEGVLHTTGTYSEVKRCAFKNADATYTYAVPVSVDGSHNLLEDCWVYGGGRKLIIVGGSFNVIRRCVVRWDFQGGDPQPESGITIYDGTNSIIENCIALDFNRPGIGTPYGSFRGKGTATRNKFYGNIALNNPAFAGYWPAEWADGQVYNSVAWGKFELGSIHYEGTTLSDQVTVGGNSSGGLTMVNYGSGLETNNIYANNSAASIDDTGGISASYDLIYNSPDITGSNKLTSNPQIKYIVQNECSVTPSLPQCGSGSGGKNRGANILKRYLNGVETNVNLWPWPNEARIKSDMCESNPAPAGTYPQTHNPNRGFCLAQTLTAYIWEYLGNPCPVGICAPSVPDTTPPAPPSGLIVI